MPSGHGQYLQKGVCEISKQVWGSPQKRRGVVRNGARGKAEFRPCRVLGTVLRSLNFTFEAKSRDQEGL